MLSRESAVTFALKTTLNCHPELGFRIQYSAIRTDETLPCDAREEFQCDNNK